MTLNELMSARDDHLVALRRDAVPMRRQQLQDLESYVAGKVAALGPLYTELVFMEENYERKPQNHKHWSAEDKKEYERSLRSYRLRVKGIGGGGIQGMPYAKLEEHERQKLDRFIEILSAYINTIESR
jgi:hypothetical protein